MHRSSSAAQIRIDFDPREVKVGSSSIDKLPIRRVQSSKSISKASFKAPNQSAVIQSQQYHNDLLKRINESLERQNAYLKKQLQFYTNACSSRRSSVNALGSSSKKQEQRSKILSRLESKMQKNETIESTALFSSKMSSAKKMTEQSISELYDKFTIKSILPKPEIILDLLKSIIQDTKDNLFKLKPMVEKIKLQKTKTVKQIDSVMGHLESIVIGQATKKQKPGQCQGKNTHKEQLLEEFFNEFSSNSDLLTIFQLLLLKLTRSKSLLEKVKSSIGFARFIKKMNRMDN